VRASGGSRGLALRAHDEQAAASRIASHIANARAAVLRLAGDAAVKAEAAS